MLGNVILLCFCLIFFGMVFSFEGIRKNGFGEEKKGIEITEEYIRVLDFKMNKK